MWETRFVDHELVLARFQPKRTDDLAPNMADFIGRDGVFSAGPFMDAGRYAGQRSMDTPPAWHYEDLDRPVAAWVPECDLDVLPDQPTQEELRRRRREAIEAVRA